MRPHLGKPTISGRDNILIFDEGVGLDRKRTSHQRAPSQLIEVERIAVVAGGSRGIGGGIVRRLASDGAAVGFTYSSSEEKAKQLAGEIRDAGGNVLLIKADSASVEVVRAAVDQAAKELGELDIFVARWPGGAKNGKSMDRITGTDEIVLAAQRRLFKMRKRLLVSALALATVSAGSVLAHPAAREPLDSAALNSVRSQFVELMDLANRHDLKALHKMFWQSPSSLLVAKSAIPSDGNWAGFWGNEAIDQKLHDIATSGPVVLQPDLSKLKVVGLTHDIAESYAPMNITVSYAGQDGTPRPFLMIIDWIKVGKDWRVASEIILPVPPAPAAEH